MADDAAGNKLCAAIIVHDESEEDDSSAELIEDRDELAAAATSMIMNSSNGHSGLLMWQELNDRYEFVENEELLRAISKEESIWTPPEIVNALFLRKIRNKCHEHIAHNLISPHSKSTATAASPLDTIIDYYDLWVYMSGIWSELASDKESGVGEEGLQLTPDEVNSVEEIIRLACISNSVASHRVTLDGKRTMRLGSTIRDREHDIGELSIMMHFVLTVGRAFAGAYSRGSGRFKRQEFIQTKWPSSKSPGEFRRATDEREVATMKMNAHFEEYLSHFEDSYADAPAFESGSGRGDAVGESTGGINGKRTMPAVSYGNLVVVRLDDDHSAQLSGEMYNLGSYNRRSNKAGKNSDSPKLFQECAVGCFIL